MLLATKGTIPVVGQGMAQQALRHPATLVDCQPKEKIAFCQGACLPKGLAPLGKYNLLSAPPSSTISERSDLAPRH